MEEVRNKKPDRRIAKTKRAICNAFTELMSKKEMSEITIKDIADLADVNRKTVYNYYGSIYDILDEIENNIMKAFEKVMKDVDFSCTNYGNTYRVFDTLNEVMKSDLEFYSHLMEMNTNVGLLFKLITYLKGRVGESFIKGGIFKDTNKVELATTYIVTGMVAAYKAWFTSNRNIPLDEYSKDASELVVNGLRHFIK